MGASISDREASLEVTRQRLKTPTSKFDVYRRFNMNPVPSQMSHSSNEKPVVNPRSQQDAINIINPYARVSVNNDKYIKIDDDDSQIRFNEKVPRNTKNIPSKTDKQASFLKTRQDLDLLQRYQ